MKLVRLLPPELDYELSRDMRVVSLKYVMFDYDEAAGLGEAKRMGVIRIDCQDGMFVPTASALSDALRKLADHIDATAQTTSLEPTALPPAQPLLTKQ